MRKKKIKERTTGYKIGIVVAFGVGIAVALLLEGSVDHNKLRMSAMESNYCVMPPSVPEQADFAGETIDLKRYDRREKMDRELMSFTYMHSTTLLMIKRANRYFPVVEPILEENGIPDDFKYLMAIESSLNTVAHSPAGAAGLWQFMPATAKEYGLQVDDEVDERYHIEKATVAACRYLKKAYAKYGNWMSVAASYNAGQGRISSELDRQLATHAMDLWLVEETSRYMFRLLAVKSIFSNPSQYGFLLRREQLYPPIPYESVVVEESISNLDEYARQQGLSYALLKDANPWLRAHKLTVKDGMNYELHLPTQEGMFYNPKKNKPYNPQWVVD